MKTDGVGGDVVVDVSRGADCTMPAAVTDGPDVLGRIARARRNLLDLSSRNRLISTPRGPSRARKIDVVDERTGEVFRLLVAERKAMSFLPGTGEDEPEDADDAGRALAQPGDEPAMRGGPEARHVDLKLQTRLKSEALQARLLGMYYDAQTYEQEQGVSILYLAAGFLRWYESPSSEVARYAPLLLLPVDLERPSASGRFHVKLRDEDIATNLSLRAKLAAEFGLDLPEVPDTEDFSPAAYFDAVHAAVATKPRWQVLPDDMVLWFFSFAKYLMYRDLDPNSWPAHAPLESNPVLGRLLGEGFDAGPPLFSDSEKIDPLIPPEAMVHVTDADSSQAVVIEEVRRGRHLVVQGPPGTGKSQTITNLIASAVKEGKKVLFVAEKMAALDVVHGRLERLGLGPLCLQLHSSKASKKAVLAELARTLALGRPKVSGASETIDALRSAIGRLNRHAEAMNTPEPPSGLTPFQVIGRLSSLYARGVEATGLGLAGLEAWTAHQFRDRCRDVEDLGAYLEALGPPASHPWRGVTRSSPILHEERARLDASLGEALASLGAIDGAWAELAGALGLPDHPGYRLRDVQQLAQFGIRLVKAPPADRTGLAGPSWAGRRDDLDRLVSRGRALAEGRYAEPHRRLGRLGEAVARIGVPADHPWRGAGRAEAPTPEELADLPDRISAVADALRSALDAAGRLGRALGLPAREGASWKEAERLEQLALQIVEAPTAGRSRIDDPAWGSRGGQIADLVRRGQALAAGRAAAEGKVADVAWRADLASTRRHLAGHGRSIFRWLSRDYRSAVVTLRGILKGDAPRSLDERLAILDAVIAVQVSSGALDEEPAVAQLGRDAFGGDWRGSASDWGRLAEVVAWDAACRAAGLGHDHRAILAALEGVEACRTPLEVFSKHLRTAFDQFQSLLKDVGLDARQAFGAVSVTDVPVADLVGRLDRWRECPGGLADWIAYRESRRLVEEAGLGPAASKIHEGRSTPAAAIDEIRGRFHGELGGEAGEAEALGRDAFGEAWQGISSDWEALQAVLAWDRECRDAGLPWDHRRHLARLESTAPLRAPLKILVDRFKQASALLHDLAQAVALDVPAAFGADSPVRVPVRELLSRLAAWQAAPEGLTKWIGYRIRRCRLDSAGLAPLAEALHSGRVPAASAADQLRVAYHQALIASVLGRHPGLAAFDGQTQDRWVEEFRALDHARIDLARAEVAAVHHDAIPRTTGGEMAVVRREIEKKRNHKPIRKLLREAGTAIQGIKPVFLMSPISVAQFLEPGGATFDLLLIDEASQISPVDALGAMARARQVVVVGDDKQLPPTRFFARMLDDAGADVGGDDDLEAGDLESILGLCSAQGMPQRMLRWHYRSRHHSLIAVSNREFYEDNLYVVPSPTTAASAGGLVFRPVRDGVFDRGGAATNRVEARAVARAVVEHARTSPRKSLGVGCFSVAQRDAVRDELEVLQRENPDLAGFFSPGAADPFFVKNLENIQGDERDVIFISVGYGRDPSGFMSMAFGPLSTEGGERRLNVLISRARERCEVFASITHDDIELQRARSRGAAAFKTFLRYAATGELDHREPTGAGFDSEFERQVAAALEGLGHEVHCQVGTAGFAIDLAVVDPSRPGRYLLGIECDGATYHSSRSARDRDRIREAVLRDRGWKIHRIWSTDWFHRPGEQLRRVLEAIDLARAELDADEAESGEQEPFNRDSSEAIERSDPGGVDVVPPDSWVVPYVEADFQVASGTPIHETAPATLADVVARVVEIEGPIHREEVARRLASLWGLQRSGSRIIEAADRAIEAATLSGRLGCDAGFVSPAAMAAPPVRSRDAVASAGLRRPEMLPPAEVREAILRLVSDHVGPGREELASMVARTLGFRSAGSKLREVVDGVSQALVDGAEIELRDGRAYRS